MLSRETCEALAAAIPEVRGRETFREGDRFYLQDGTHQVVSIGVPFCPLGRSKIMPIWCPTLSDLLAMVPDHTRLVREGRSWRITARGAMTRFGATPEEAVAAWLLARAGQSAST